jgi:tetratricopeptide (TPR) repeat protein
VFDRLRAHIGDLGDARRRSWRAATRSYLFEVVASNGGEKRRVVARDRDIYAFTAPLVVEATLRILDGRADSVGTFAPGELFDARDFLAALTHLEVEYHCPSETTNVVLSLLRRRKAKKLLNEALECAGRDATRAVRLLEESVAVDPNGAATPLTMLGNHAFQSGDWQRARDRYQGAIALRADDLHSHVWLGESLHRLGDYAQARAAFATALALPRTGRDDPRLRRRALRGVGLAAFAAGDWDDAKAQLSCAVDSYGNDFEAWSALGHVLAHNGDRAAAANAFRYIVRGDRDDLLAFHDYLAAAGTARAIWPSPELEPARLSELFNHLRSRRFDEATRALDVIVAQTADASTREHLRAFVLRRSGRVDEATTLFCGSDGPLWTYERALLDIASGRESAALAGLELLHRARVPLPSIAFLLAIRHHVLGGVAAAEQLYRSVSDEDPGDGEALLLWALLLRTHDRAADALALQRRAFVSNPILLAPAARFRLSVVNERFHRQLRARADEQLRATPGSTEARLERARALDFLGEHRAALADAIAVIERDDKIAAAHVRVGMARWSLGELAGACDAFARAIALDGRSAVALASLGHLLVRRDRDAEADEPLARALALDPHNFHAHAARAIRESKRGCYAAAEAAYFAATRVLPTSPEPHANLTIDYMKQRRFADAERAARAVLALAPHDVDAHVTLAAALRALDRHEEADTIAARARALSQAAMVTLRPGADAVPGSLAADGSQWDSDVRETLRWIATRACTDVASA